MSCNSKNDKASFFETNPESCLRVFQALTYEKQARDNHTSDWLFNPLSAELTKWPNTLKQFVGNLPTNCLSVFGHFVGSHFNLLCLVRMQNMKYISASL